MPDVAICAEEEYPVYWIDESPKQGSISPIINLPQEFIDEFRAKASDFWEIHKQLEEKVKEHYASRR